MKTLLKNHRSNSVARLIGAGDAADLLDYCLQKSFIHREDWQHSSPETLKQIENETNVVALLEALVQTKLLTRYQADRIEAGTTHGLILGSYRVLDRLGAGGMGVVFLAEHIHLRRLVAIKMLPLYAGADPGGRCCRVSSTRFVSSPSCSIRISSGPSTRANCRATARIADACTTT